jgi:GNAT superfamily N-acetyltransferase
MPELRFRLVDDDATFDAIPDPMAPGARCQTCDYWERVDGHREGPAEGATDAEARASLKRSRLRGDTARGGSLGMVAFDGEAPAGYAQFGPLSAYPRAQTIRERYPELPESPAPWVVTCLQVPPATPADRRAGVGAGLLSAVCDELDRRGITAVEAYPERAADPWLPSPGPASVYEAAGFERAAGDDRYPVYRRELSGETDADAWSDLLRASRPADDDEGWPLPLPSKPHEDDFFRLPPEKPKRPNPFGED